MSSINGQDYEFIFIDFEYRPAGGIEGSPLEVICMVAFNSSTNQYTRLWADELASMKDHPFDNNEKTILVAYYASAEMACFQALGWSWPKNVLDLFVEFKNMTNGYLVPMGSSLLGAMKFFDLQAIESEHKESMRTLALRGQPFSETEKAGLIEYCQSDVDALQKLFTAMALDIDLPRALIRGQYSIPLAQMEGHGIPIDMEIYQELCSNWDSIKLELIDQIDSNYGVYENGSFRQARFEAYLAKEGIAWPRQISGKLKLDEETFKTMSKIHPIVAPLRQLRDSLGKLRLNSLQIGTDGRNRCLISPYSSSTGRNQPSTSKFIFGLAKWARGLIRPHAGNAVAYIDWSQQEFGVAAALSGDQNMMAAYHSGDPYLAFAKQAGAVPQDATKATHPMEREQYKACVLATQYGMGAEALALRLKQPILRAKQLLRAHRQVFKQFWDWSDQFYDRAVNANKAFTVLGWGLHVKDDVNPRSLRNFPVQANSAEMLRIACILIARENIKICAPVHDAILIESKVEDIERDVEIAQSCMKEASRIILNGFELNSDVEIFKYPQRFLNPSSEEFWHRVMDIKDKIISSSGNTLRPTC